MKKLLILALLLVVFAVICGGCDYITGKALDKTATATSPRWMWSLVDNTYPSTIVDRQTHQLIKDASPEEVFGIIGTSSYLGNPKVIDVRTPQEYYQGHIWNSLNVDYSSQSFTDIISQFDRNYTYIVYCQSGYRSNLACNVMESLGFKYVINMTGGYYAWLASGLPVEI
jgi:rhodanese-related sulfurtransferase